MGRRRRRPAGASTGAGAGYTIDEMTQAAGASRRTIRSWVARGLLAAPERRGPSTRYSPKDHERAVAIARLRREGLSLDDVARRLAKEEAAAEAAAKAPAPPALPETVRLPPSPSYPAAAWERVQLVPGLELHVDGAGGPVLRRLAQAIYDWFGPGGGAGLPTR